MIINYQHINILQNCLTLNKEQEDKLKSFYKYHDEVYSVLDSIKKDFSFDDNIEIFLVGGAIRDLVLKKNNIISDLDFLIKIPITLQKSFEDKFENDGYFRQKCLINLISEKIESDKPKKDYSNYEFNLKFNKEFLLIEYLNNLFIKKFGNINKLNKDSYNGLFGKVFSLFKIKNHLDYCVDIVILKDIDPIEYIEKYFDFSLSKIFFSFKDRDCMRNNINILDEFLYSIQNNEIIFNMAKHSTKNQTYIIENRIDKIIAKYPEYKFLFKNIPSDESIKKIVTQKEQEIILNKTLKNAEHKREIIL